MFSEMSDHEEKLERANSTSSTPELYDSVPEPTRFKFQMEDIRFDYILRKGKSLPYSTSVKGNTKLYVDKSSITPK